MASSMRDEQKSDGSAVESRAMTISDILGCLVEFVADRQYLFFATVFSSWKAAWGPRLPLTSYATLDTSVSQLQHSFDCGLPHDQDATCKGLASLGNPGLLKCARENGCPWNEETCSEAAAGGHLELLQWARQNGCPWDGETWFFAAEQGHLSVLKWARRNGCPRDDFTCCTAAKGEHLAVLKWARRNGCPWDEFTCSSAAEEGHIDILKQARQNGCP